MEDTENRSWARIVVAPEDRAREQLDSIPTEPEPFGVTPRRTEAVDAQLYRLREAGLRPF